MTGGAATREDWATRRERGFVPLIRLMAWIALRIGRPAAQLLLLPACAYFLLFAPKARAAGLVYLKRALGRPPTMVDRWRHYRCFAICVLDRVLLLNDRLDLFEISVRGEETVMANRENGGCFLFGAHLGSFEVIRAVGRLTAKVKLSLVMYQDNARKTNTVLTAINPALAIEIIGLGKPGSMLAVRDRLDEGHVVGILADRSVVGERTARIPFLGAPARFPIGPFRMAAMLRRPIVLMVGTYRGGRRYEVVFESISDGSEGTPIEETMRRYVALLEQHCRETPYNWFNFYDFWA